MYFSFLAHSSYIIGFHSGVSRFSILSAFWFVLHIYPSDSFVLFRSSSPIYFAVTYFMNDLFMYAFCQLFNSISFFGVRSGDTTSFPVVLAYSFFCILADFLIYCPLQFLSHSCPSNQSVYNGVNILLVFFLLIW